MSILFWTNREISKFPSNLDHARSLSYPRNEMASDNLPIIANGPFDDVNPSVVPADRRQGGHFVDDETMLEWSEGSASGDEDDDIDDEYDNDRVEDEDWEIAEGGTLIIYI